MPSRLMVGHHSLEVGILGSSPSSATKMVTIKSSLIWQENKYLVEYCDLDSFHTLPYTDCQQVYCVCFVGDKIVIAWGEDGNYGGSWSLIGGHIEKDETYIETLKREVEEEANMEVVWC